jgi:hypothetical protein
MPRFNSDSGYWEGDEVRLKGRVSFVIPDPTPEAGQPGPEWGATFTADEVNSPDFGTVLDEWMREAARCHVAEVERRILAGENRVEMPYGDMLGQKVVYTVPVWHREPIKRLRVEWARWKARRG